MSNGTCDLTPNPAFVPAYRSAYNQTIKQIETDLRSGRVPDIDGEIARLQATVLSGTPADSGRMAAFADYRSILTGQCSPPQGHPSISFSARPGEPATVGSANYPTNDVTLSVAEGGKTRTSVIRGAIDDSRLSDAERSALEHNPNYVQRHIRVVDDTPGGNRMPREVTYFVPVARHPIAHARRPLLARTD